MKKKSVGRVRSNEGKGVAITSMAGVPVAKKHVSTRQAAKMCGVSVFTIQRWFDKGHFIGAKTPGGRRRIDSRSLDDFMRKQGMAARSTMHRVLLVDDEPKLLAIMKDVLSVGERFEVRTASNCLEAGMLLSSFQPDTFVLDVMLDDTPASELVRKARRHIGDKMRIVVISGRSSATDIKEMMDAGANVYLPKPFRHEELIDAIEGREVARARR